MNVPIIRIELESMRYGIRQALMQHTLNIDEQAQKEIDQFATEENLAAIIGAEVRKAISSAVSEEVQRFFMYTGRGRMVIREAVTEYLNDAYPLEALK